MLHRPFLWGKPFPTNELPQKKRTITNDTSCRRLKYDRRYCLCNIEKPLRLGLYGFSDVELTRMIQEHPYFQYFCGYKAYDDSKPPFDSSLMLYFRKRLTLEILGEINEMVIAAQMKKLTSKDDDNKSDENSGTMIVDATCAPSQIKYPTDTELLNEARENTEAMIDTMHHDTYYTIFLWFLRLYMGLRFVQLALG